MKRIALTTHSRIKNERLDYLCKYYDHGFRFQDFVPITQYLIGDDGHFWNIFYYYENDYCDRGITNKTTIIMPNL